MTDTRKQILDLMTNNGKSAPEMTHSVKVLGNGSMQKGLTYIGEYFKEEIELAASKGVTKGRIQGGVIGALIGASLGGLAYLVVRNKKKAELHEEAGNKILKTMESSIDIKEPIVQTDKIVTADYENHKDK